MSDAIAATGFPWPDGQLLVFTRGGHRGTVVRVNRGYSFHEPRPVYYEGDPTKGLVSPAGWQIVLDVEVDGEWLYFIRAHEDEVRSYTTEHEEG
jgi:hypothetical protein